MSIAHGADLAVDALADGMIDTGENIRALDIGLFGDEVYGFDALDPVYIKLVSGQCPRVNIFAQLMYVEQWYISIYGSKFWSVSDEFLEFLTVNGII